PEQLEAAGGRGEVEVGGEETEIAGSLEGFGERRVGGKVRQLGWQRFAEQPREVAGEPGAYGGLVNGLSRRDAEAAAGRRDVEHRELFDLFAVRGELARDLVGHHSPHRPAAQAVGSLRLYGAQGREVALRHLFQGRGCGGLPFGSLEAVDRLIGT